MFLNWGRLSLRPALPSDRNAVVSLTRHERRVHTHLDWRPVEDWLGVQPFLLAERGKRPVGALACPPAPPDTAWLRLFAVADGLSEATIWNLLWPEARGQLQALGVKIAAVLCLEDWIEPLCQATGFEQTHAVVVLSWAGGPVPPLWQNRPAAVRQARSEDTEAIIAADAEAFVSPWQLSPEMIRLAMAQADFLTVAEAGGRVAAYQLTTPSPNGAHLARLAVRPEWQGRGLGTALTAHMLHHYHGRGAREITVNTQDSNAASLALYRRLGFELTGTRFPVFQLSLG